MGLESLDSEILLWLISQQLQQFSCEKCIIFPTVTEAHNIHLEIHYLRYPSCYVCTHIHTHMHIYITHLHTYTYSYTCIHTCILIYIYIYLFIFTFWNTSLKLTLLRDSHDFYKRIPSKCVPLGVNKDDSPVEEQCALPSGLWNQTNVVSTPTCHLIVMQNSTDFLTYASVFSSVE